MLLSGKEQEMYGFLDESHNKLNHRCSGSGMDPLSDGLGSRSIYGSPFRDINHDTSPLKDS